MNMNPIPYGAQCTWWDSIDKVGELKMPSSQLTRGDGSQTALDASSLPCCPVCKGVLFQVNSIEEWNKDVRDHAERTGDAEYPAFIEWLRGRCFPDYGKAKFCYINRDKFAEDIGKGPFAGTMTHNRVRGA